MATLTFDKATPTAKAAPSGTTTVVGQYELTAALADNDVITGLPVPLGAVITDVVLETDELDTNASPTLTLNVGDASDEDRFIDGATTGSAFNTTSINVNGVSSGTISAGRGYEYTADSTIIITVDGAPATGATSGLVTLTVTYTVDAF